MHRIRVPVSGTILRSPRLGVKIVSATIKNGKEEKQMESIIRGKQPVLSMLILFAIGAVLTSGTAICGPVTEIEFWSPFPAGDFVSPTSALAKLVTRFNDEHTDIVVKHTGYPINELGQKYMMAIAAGTLPDIGWGAPTSYYSEENIVPIDKLAQRDNYNTEQFWPGLWGGSAMINGRQWGYPFEVGAQGLIYNKDRFAKLGLGRAPETWDEFLAYAKKLTDPEKRTYALQPVWAWQSQVPWVWRAKADIISQDGTKVTFTDKKTVAAVQWMGDLEAIHAVTGGSVPAGTAAMIVVHPGWYTFSQSFEFEVGYAQPPIPANGQHISRSYYQELVIFRSNRESEEAAWQFIKWLMAPENIAVWNASTGYLPTSRAVLETDIYSTWLRENPGMKPWIKSLENIRTLPRMPGFGEIGSLFGQALNKVRAGEASAYVALSEVQERAQAKLDEINSD